MRVDAMLNRVADMRARLGLPTPCPDCSDPKRSTYCTSCVRALAGFLGETEDHVRATYGRKRGQH